MPPTFEEEEQRLHAVAGLQLLDRPEEERFRRITRLVRSHFQAVASSITIVDRDRQFFVSQQGLPCRETPLEDSVCAMVVREKEPMVITDMAEHHRTRHMTNVHEVMKLRFYAGVPLWSPEGWALGSLCVLDDRPRHFTPDELSCLADFGAIVEDELFLKRVGRANQELVDQVERLRLRAFVDALTGVWNRGALFDLLHRETERAKRSGSPLAVAMLDIDHFKGVNDTYGHPGGDEVLTELCRRLREEVRAYDSVGRYGGEEFAVVFPDTRPELVAGLGERLRRAVEEAPFVLGNQRESLTISVGMACLEGEDDTVDALLQRADEALYRAKGEGRNRVICA